MVANENNIATIDFKAIEGKATVLITIDQSRYEDAATRLNKFRSELCGVIAKYTVRPKP